MVEKKVITLKKVKIEQKSALLPQPGMMKFGVFTNKMGLVIWIDL